MSEHATALALQDAAREQAEDVAAAIARPASERDPAAIRKAWAALEALRPRLNASYRKLRREPSHPRAKLSRSAWSAQQARDRDLRLMRRRLHLWDNMARLVDRHIDPVETPLTIHEPQNRSDDLLTLIYGALHRLANPHAQSGTLAEAGAFADIALPIQPFHAACRAAYRFLLAQGRSIDAHFLDIGAGGGTKLLAASLYFEHCTGLEYDVAYAEAARQMLNAVDAPRCTVREGDALAMDDFAPFDVIYMYRIFKVDDLLRRIEARIQATARPGTVVILPYHLAEPRDDVALAHVTGPVFITGSDQTEADRLHRDASRTGVEVVQRARDLPFDCGFWAPILDAASFNADPFFSE